MFIDINMLIDCIILLIQSGGKPQYKQLVEKLIIIYEADMKTGRINDEKTFRFYIAIIRELLAIDFANTSLEMEYPALLLKFRSNAIVMSNPDIYDTIQNIFSAAATADLDAPHIVSRVIDIATKIREKIIWVNSMKSVKKMFGQLNEYSVSVDDHKKSDIMSGIRSVANDFVTEFDSSVYMESSQIDKIDFGDKTTLVKALSAYQVKKVQNIFKFGWQGFNRLFGKSLGAALGESVVFNALSHHYKSSMLLNVARWCIRYNKPVNVGPGKPTFLFISLENESSENMMLLFKDAYANITGTSCDGRSDEEIVEFIYEYFNVNGWSLIIERRLGESFGTDEFKVLFNEYTSQGRCILGCAIDYINLMKKRDTGNTGNHLQLREVYNVLVNFTKHNNCSLFSGHQLNRQAAELARSGVTNVVDKFGIAHLADGMDPQREVDVCIYMYKEFNGYGVPYLTLKIDKHRYDTDTPEAWKRTAYRFTQHGIPDDVEGEDMSVRDIYADTYVPPEVAIPADIVNSSQPASAVLELDAPADEGTFTFEG